MIYKLLDEYRVDIKSVNKEIKNEAFLISYKELKESILKIKKFMVEIYQDTDEK
jgi:hypothetical protein